MPDVTMNNTTIFLDRDGVVNYKLDNTYVKSWFEFEFLPQAKEALRFLSEAGYRLIIVTNQRGVALGLMNNAEVEDIHSRMLAELENAGAKISAVYYCPHEKGQCDCRKPEVGMFLQAQKDFPAIDFTNAVMIGDSLSDMEAGHKLRCRNILIGENLDYEDASSLYEAVIKYLS